MLYPGHEQAELCPFEEAGAEVRTRALPPEVAAWWWLAHHDDDRDREGGVRARQVERLRSGELLLLLRERPRGQTATRPETAPAPRITAPGPSPGVAQEWVGVQVVQDLSAEPIANVTLMFVLSDGREQQVTTDQQGRGRVSQVAPGSCDLRATRTAPAFSTSLAFVGFGRPVPRPPDKRDLPRLVPIGRARSQATPTTLVEVELHRVRDGETWESIAAARGISPAELQRFNFDTVDPDQLQVAMAAHLGCWQVDRGSGDLVFASQDEPGILLIPRAWTRSVDTGYEHIVRVKAVSAVTRAFVFSA